MKSFRTVVSNRRSKVVYSCALLLFALKFQAAAQVSIYTASYDGNGNDTTGTTVALNPFTVTGFFTSNSTTTESVFITDGTANGRIFGSDSLFTGMTVGSQYTASVTTAIFQGTEEFKTPTAITATGMLTAVTPTSVALSQISTTSPIAASPSDPNYAATGNLLFAPISFTITPNATGTVSTSTSTTLTDSASGIPVIFFRAATAIPYTSGVTYNVLAYESPFNGNAEIVGATSFTPVPEPSTYTLIAISVVALVVTARGMYRQAERS